MTKFFMNNGKSRDFVKPAIAADKNARSSHDVPEKGQKKSALGEYTSRQHANQSYLADQIARDQAEQDLLDAESSRSYTR